MSLCKTIPELISRLNSYTLEELIEELVYTAEVVVHNPVSYMQTIMYPTDDLLWDDSGYKDKVWNYQVILKACMKLLGDNKGDTAV